MRWGALVTKLRAPLTIENALVEVASVLGYERMGEIAGVHARTVRKWADPEASERCSIEVGVAFDIAYQQAGGEGAPIYEAYGLMIEAARAQKFSDAAAIARHALNVMKEAGEAEMALVAASLPSATKACRLAAVREVEEAVGALTQSLPALTKGIVPDEGAGEGSALGGFHE